MMNNMMMPQEQQPQQQQQPPPTDDEIAGGHQAVEATMDGLIRLVGMQPGTLTKKAVFDEASTMIADGAFPTPESKQQLIGELAKLPNDEQDIRKMLSQFLLAVSTFRSHMHNAFGPPKNPADALQAGVLR